MLHTTNIQDLRFHHFVEESNHGLVFASARDSKNRIYNFLINRYADVILQQVRGHFEQISGEVANFVKDNFEHSYSTLPVKRKPVQSFPK